MGESIRSNHFYILAFIFDILVWDVVNYSWWPKSSLSPLKAEPVSSGFYFYDLPSCTCIILSGGEDKPRPHIFTCTRLGPFFLHSLKDMTRGGTDELRGLLWCFFICWRVKGRGGREKKEGARRQSPLCFSQVLIHNGFLLMHSWGSVNGLSLHSNGVFVAL